MSGSKHGVEKVDRDWDIDGYELFSFYKLSVIPASAFLSTNASCLYLCLGLTWVLLLC